MRSFINYPPAPPDWPGGYWWHWLVFTLIIIAFVMTMALIFIWYERRLVGRFQSRLGPNRAGPFGFFQPVADAIKILTKEDIITSRGDRVIFWIAPIVGFVSVVMIFAVVPFWEGAVLVDLDAGLLFVLAMGVIPSIGIFMAGWASNNKYALIGAIREVALLISYEIPMGLALVGVILMANSLSLEGIVQTQEIPFFVLQPLGFFVFLVASLAEINRTPFDLIEADSEIVAGYNIEYSGAKFAVLYLTEYAEALAASVLLSTLFLGGWRGPILPPVIWFLIKVMAMFILIVWIRSTLPRLRIDQMMSFNWKLLLPLALINLAVVTLVVFSSLPGWVAFISGSLVLIIYLALWSVIFRRGGKFVQT
jgi:NADH-quinone oxidoreductase subunit H